MIRYTVVWDDIAQDRLAQIWLDATNRSAITSTANTIDMELANDPQTKGLDVEGGLKEWIEPPLQVLFRVSELDRIVKVVDVERT